MFLNIDFEKEGGVEGIEEVRDIDKNNYVVFVILEILYLRIGN